jgi:ABC-type Fe3+/spermidine/putrescine transport system ATPase subunit
MLLSIRNVTKRYGHVIAVDGVSLDVAEGEIVCLLGPSGCGKTTLLRIVAGLESADAGRVLWQGKDISRTPPHQRDFGLMFQDYALFPHKNVVDNVAFGLHMKGVPEREVQARVSEVLRLVGLEGFGQRNVNELSGGEAQRVALARSLAPRPRLLMLDEPLGSLDRALRERLMLELRDILTGIGVTALYVTHDQAEAFAVADRAVVMRAGGVEQIDRPEMIYRCPATPFVAHFLGLTNLVEGKVSGQDRVTSPWGELYTGANRRRVGEPVIVLIRPEAATLVEKDGPPGSDNIIRGRLSSRSFRGGRYRIEVEPESGPALTFEMTTVSPLAYQSGDVLELALNPAGVVLLPLPSDGHSDP